MSRYQSWNKRSKKWVLFEGGKIKDMQPGQFEGVTVKKGKPEPAADPEPAKDPEPKPAEDPKPKQDQEPKKEKKKARFMFFG